MASGTPEATAWWSGAWRQGDKLIREEQACRAYRKQHLLRFGHRQNAKRRTVGNVWNGPWSRPLFKVRRSRHSDWSNVWRVSWALLGFTFLYAILRRTDFGLTPVSKPVTIPFMSVKQASRVYFSWVLSFKESGLKTKEWPLLLFI